MMSVELFITRKNTFSDSSEKNISIESWFKYVESDDDLYWETDSDLVICKINCRYGEQTWFEWSNGEIYTKNPDAPILAKMLKIAEQLNAIIRDDDFNIYKNNTGYPS